MSVGLYEDAFERLSQEIDSQTQGMRDEELDPEVLRELTKRFQQVREVCESLLREVYQVLEIATDPDIEFARAMLELRRERDDALRRLAASEEGLRLAAIQMELLRCQNDNLLQGSFGTRTRIRSLEDQVRLLSNRRTAKRSGTTSDVGSSSQIQSEDTLRKKLTEAEAAQANMAQILHQQIKKYEEVRFERDQLARRLGYTSPTSVPVGPPLHHNHGDLARSDIPDWIKADYRKLTDLRSALDQSELARKDLEKLRRQLTAENLELLRKCVALAKNADDSRSGLESVIARQAEQIRQLLAMRPPNGEDV